MKYLRFLVFLWVVWLTTSAAWAQFGLYGSPELLRLPEVQPAQIPSYNSYPTRPNDGYRIPSEAETISPGSAYFDVAPATRPVPTAAADAAPDPGYPNPLVRQATGEPAPLLPRLPLSADAFSLLKPAKPTPAKPRELRQKRSKQKKPKQSEPEHVEPGPISQMLEESGCFGSAPCDPPETDFGRGWGFGLGWRPFGRALSGPSVDECSPCFESVWFARGHGLVMSRNRANRVWTTYETNVNANQLMNTQDIGLSWTGGGEISFGRHFYCGLWALEATYWTLAPFAGIASQSMAGGSVSTPLLVDGVEFAGTNGTVYFDSAEEHRLWRRDEFHNVEINLIRKSVAGGLGSTGYDGLASDGCNIQNCGYDGRRRWGPTPATGCGFCRPLVFDWSVGARFFRFEEDLTFGSVDTGRTWGEAGGIWEVYLHDKVVNNLAGFQLACNVNYQFGNSWRLFLTPKVGIYNNHIQHRFELYRGDGVVANPTAISGVVGTYPVSSTKNVIAFLSQVDLGLDWQVTPRWNALIGYRVIFATGIGLADNQIPPYIVDIPEIADIDHNGDLVLHGGFVGLQYNF